MGPCRFDKTREHDDDGDKMTEGMLLAAALARLFFLSMDQRFFGNKNEEKGSVEGAASRKMRRQFKDF